MKMQIPTRLKNVFIHNHVAESTKHFKFGLVFYNLFVSMLPVLLPSYFLI